MGMKGGAGKERKKRGGWLKKGEEEEEEEEVGGTRKGRKKMIQGFGQGEKGVVKILTQMATRGNYWLLWLIQTHLTYPGLGVRHYCPFRRF